MATAYSHKESEVRLLEQWIDGTSIESTVPEQADWDINASGFAWSLYQNCMQLLNSFLQVYKGLEGEQRNLETRQLKECATRLFLWGEGFSGGQLDTIVQRSDVLKVTIIQFVTAIATILLDDLLPQLPSSPRLADISSSITDLRSLVEKVGSFVDDDSPQVDFSDSDSDSEDTPASSKYSSEGSPGQDSAKNINSYLSCLMGILPSMEQVLNAREEQDVTSSPIEFRVSDAASTYILNVRDKFRDADEKLVRRLGEANFQRYVAIRQLKAQKPGALETTSASEDNGQKPQSVFAATSLFLDSGLGTNPAASAYAESHSSFRTSGSEAGKGSVRFPEAPVGAYEGVPFSCFICGHVLKNIKNRYDWKIHVFADIQPYICTFSECADSLRTFPTRRLWQEHEFSQHRLDITWKCSVCNKDFSTAEEWKEDVDSNHRKSLADVEYQYAFAAAKRTRVHRIGLQRCPLCLKTPGTSQREFTTHVCKHMESIALGALPYEDKTSDFESEAEDQASPGLILDNFSQTSNEEVPRSESHKHEVDRILAEKTEHGETLYLISWKGYAQHRSNWEPKANILDLEIIRLWEARKLRESQGLESPFHIALYESNIQSLVEEGSADDSGQKYEPQSYISKTRESPMRAYQTDSHPDMTYAPKRIGDLNQTPPFKSQQQLDIPPSSEMLDYSALPKAQRKTKGHIASACIPCKRAHLRCDAQRPCSRCFSNGKEDACVDVQYKKRGRPRLRDEREQRYDPLNPGFPEHNSSMRRPLSLYEPESTTTIDSYRILKSQNPLAPRHLEHEQRPSPSMLSGALPSQEPLCAYLTMAMEIIKVSRSFGDLVGSQALVSRRLHDLVSDNDREKIARLQRLLDEERREKEPTYLPPIFLKFEESRIIQSVGLTQDEIFQLQLGHQEVLTFGIGGQKQTLRAQFGLAKKESTYFVAVVFQVSASQRGSYLTPRNELPPDVPQKQHDLQLPPIRDQQSGGASFQRAGQVDLGGLLEQPRPSAS